MYTFFVLLLQIKENNNWAFLKMKKEQLGLNMFVYKYIYIYIYIYISDGKTPS